MDLSKIINYGQTSHIHSQLGNKNMDVAWQPKRGETNKQIIEAYVSVLLWKVTSFLDLGQIPSCYGIPVTDCAYL
jgi:hypothetical protein